MPSYRKVTFIKNLGYRFIKGDKIKVRVDLASKYVKCGYAVYA